MARSVALLAAAATAATAVASPLWDYVNRPDPAFTWRDTGIKLDQQLGWTGYLLNVTSQTWLTPADSTAYVWTHQLLVVIPWNLNTAPGGGTNLSANGAIWITGGDNTNPNSVPANDDEDTLVCASLATDSGTVCAVLYQVPNQPILFAADTTQSRRSEDAAVAFTWWNFAVNHPDKAEWVLYLPMAKAVKAAMDTVEAWTRQQAGTPGGAYPATAAVPHQWMLFGASKRGATTWLAGAALHNRVIGIAPVVFDILNFTAGVEHMWQTLGGWTFAFADYRAMNITTLLPSSPALTALAGVVDPLVYAANLTMPKLVIDATGDEFFQPQDDQFWWGSLPGETLRMMVDNAEHSMATGALYLITGVEAWYGALIRGYPRPTFDWTIDPNPNSGAITITATGAKPDRVVLRFATTVDGNTRRDFRLIAGNTPANPCHFINVTVFGEACLRPIIWIGEDVKESDSGPSGNGPWTYVLTQPLPPTGWRGFLGELYYPGPPGTNSTFQLTTQVSIIPNTYPFPPCAGQECYGELV